MIRISIQDIAYLCALPLTSSPHVQSARRNAKDALNSVTKFVYHPKPPHKRSRILVSIDDLTIPSTSIVTSLHEDSDAAVTILVDGIVKSSLPIRERLRAGFRWLTSCVTEFVAPWRFWQTGHVAIKSAMMRTGIL